MFFTGTLPQVAWGHGKIDVPRVIAPTNLERKPPHHQYLDSRTCESRGTIPTIQ